MSENFKNWGEYKDALLEGLSEKQKTMMNVLVENAHVQNVGAVDKSTEANRVVVEAVEGGGTGVANISRYDMMFMPLIRRTMPALLAMDLVGVQPLSGPRGIVRTLRHRYSETTETTAGSGVNAVTAGDEASGVNVYEKYSLLVRGGDYDEADGLDPFAQTLYLEGDRGKPMDLEVVTQPTEPKSRKLSATYSLEAEDDLQALDGLDLEAELTQSVGDEIMRELDRELIDELTGLAGTIFSFDFVNADGRFAGERLQAMQIRMDELSSEIAVKTKKGGASWMVVSPKIFVGMKNAVTSGFIPANQGELQLGSSLFVGTMVGGIRVYVDPYATSDTILMGYKGSELDSGLIYSPYIPLSSSGVIRDPASGDSRVLLRTRYALTSFTDTATSLGDSPDYIGRMNVANLELGLK